MSFEIICYRKKKKKGDKMRSIKTLMEQGEIRVSKDKKALVVKNLDWLSHREYFRVLNYAYKKHDLYIWDERDGDYDTYGKYHLGEPA